MRVGGGISFIPRKEGAWRWPIRPRRIHLRQSQTRPHREEVQQSQTRPQEEERRSQTRPREEGRRSQTRPREEKRQSQTRPREEGRDHRPGRGWRWRVASNLYSFLEDASRVRGCKQGIITYSGSAFIFLCELTNKRVLIDENLKIMATILLDAAMKMKMSSRHCVKWCQVILDVK